MKWKWLENEKGKWFKKDQSMYLADIAVILSLVTLIGVIIAAILNCRG